MSTLIQDGREQFPRLHHYCLIQGLESVRGVQLDPRLRCRRWLHGRGYMVAGSIPIYNRQRLLLLKERKVFYFSD